MTTVVHSSNLEEVVEEGEEEEEEVEVVEEKEEEKEEKGERGGGVRVQYLVGCTSFPPTHIEVMGWVLLHKQSLHTQSAIPTIIINQGMLD